MTAKGASMTLHHLREQLDKAEAEVERLKEALNGIAHSWVIRKDSPEAVYAACEALGIEHPDEGKESQ